MSTEVEVEQALLIVNDANISGFAVEDMHMEMYTLHGIKGD